MKARDSAPGRRRPVTMGRIMEVDSGPRYNGRMSRSVSRCVFVLAGVMLSACATTQPEAREPRQPGTGRVEVTMTGFENDDGQVMVALYLDAEGWPGNAEHVFATAVVPIREAQAFAEFADVPVGPFAVSVYHDENGNRELDSSMFGIPSERYGFSAGADGLFGPPSFEEARVELAAGERKQIAIEVK